MFTIHQERNIINVAGCFFPCSFAEGEGEWQTGLSVVDAEDFERDIWNNPKTVKFRNKNIETTDVSICGDCRKCVNFPDLYQDDLVYKPHLPKKVIKIKDVK